MHEDLFPHAEFRARGYQAAVHASKAWNGVSILSREPATVLQSGLPGQEHLGTRLVSARVAGVTFITVYCPNGKHVGHDDFPRKLSWYDALLSYLEARHHQDRDDAFGIWRDRNAEGLAYERRLRREWS